MDAQCSFLGRILPQEVTGTGALWVYCPGDEAGCPRAPRAARRVSARRAPAVRHRLHPAPRALARVVVLRRGRARPRRGGRGRVIAGPPRRHLLPNDGRRPPPRRVAHAGALALDARAHPGPGLRGAVGRARAHGGSAHRARRARKRRAARGAMRGPASAARCCSRWPGSRSGPTSGSPLTWPRGRASPRWQGIAVAVIAAWLFAGWRGGARWLGVLWLAGLVGMSATLLELARETGAGPLAAWERVASQSALSLSPRQLLGDDGPGPRRGRRPRADGLRRGASRDGAVRRPAPRAVRGWRARHRAGVDPCARPVRHAARRRSARGGDGAAPALRTGQARAGRAGVGPGVVRRGRAPRAGRGSGSASRWWWGAWACSARARRGP